MRASKLGGNNCVGPSCHKPAGAKAVTLLTRSGYWARMSGMPGPMKDEKGRPTRKALSLRKWNCQSWNIINTY